MASLAATRIELRPIEWPLAIFEDCVLFQATVYEMEKLCCNLCVTIFQVPLPEQIAGEDCDNRHYDDLSGVCFP